MSDRDKERKYRDTFNQSRAKVKEWETSFFKENQRKPSKDDISKATSQIQVCYKNCWKIKSYFEGRPTKESQSFLAQNENSYMDETETTELSNEDSSRESPEDPSTKSLSFSGCFPPTSSGSGDQSRSTETAFTDISNKTKKSGVWGQHLNNSNATVKKTDNGPNNYDKIASRLAANASFGSGSRTSLKKRRKLGTNERSMSFFGTMGEDSQDSFLSQPSQLEDRSVSDLGPLKPVSPPSEARVPPVGSNPEEEDGSDSLLFPALTGTVQVVAKSLVQSRGHVAGQTQAGHVIKNRHVDTSWINRCAGDGEDAPQTGYKVAPSFQGVLTAKTESPSQNSESDSIPEPSKTLNFTPLVSTNSLSSSQIAPVSLSSNPSDSPPSKNDAPSQRQDTIEVASVPAHLAPEITKVNRDSMDSFLDSVEPISEKRPDNTVVLKENSVVLENEELENKNRTNQLFKLSTIEPSTIEAKDGDSIKPAMRKSQVVKKDLNQDVKETVTETTKAKAEVSTKRKRKPAESDEDYSPTDPEPKKQPKAKRAKRIRESEMIIGSDEEENVAVSEPVQEKVKKTIKRKKKKLSETDEEGETSPKPVQPKKRRKKAANTSVSTDEPKKKRVTRKKKVVSEDEEEANENDDGTEAPIPDGPSKVNLYALGFEDAEDVATVKSAAWKEKKWGKILTQEQKLEQKLASGKSGDNFTKIDLKKKSYSRGRTGISGSMYKRMEFKRKEAVKAGLKVKEIKCFRCGENGHWARQCTGGVGDKLIPEAMADEMGPGDFPTLEEAASMAGGGNRTKPTAYHGSSNDAMIEDIDMEAEEEAILMAAAEQFEKVPEPVQEECAVPPLIEPGCTETPDFVKEGLALFGHKSFRGGQEDAVMRIIAGQSTLVLLATGTGKSLIYQLPAYLYAERQRCITIVISPLVSLMEDQVTGLPPHLRAACLHYNMSKRAREKVVESVKTDRLHFLLVSPEAVAGGGGMFGQLIPHLPPIAFVCIDEAHCVSQWSHNFRPAYLRLAKVIRERLGVRRILGLTATAPECTIRSVADHLVVPQDGVIRGPLLPGNLTLTVSRDENRDKALLTLVAGEILADCDSIIVYCTRRNECERLATLLRTALQEKDNQGTEKRKEKGRYSETAEPYHAGLTASRRKKVQSHFMTGKLRVVVATVAFGMGIDKSDIRAIVHYNMPKTFESYIQEIGRAGRDGKPARCHLFLESEGRDLTELKRHIFSNCVDRHTVRKLIQGIFHVSEEGEKPKSQYREVALSVEKTVEQLDMPEENISTMLCYLEEGNPPWLKLHNPVYSHCKMLFYGGPRQMRAVAAKCPPLAAAIAMARQAGENLDTASNFSFPVVEVSAKMGWDSGIVKKELKDLQWISTGTGWKKSGVMVEFGDLGLHFSSLNGLSSETLDSLLDRLHNRCSEQERTELSGLHRIFKAFMSVAYPRLSDMETEENQVKSDKLKEYIAEYFGEPERVVPESIAVPETCENEGQVRSDIRNFMWMHHDQTWTGRAVARVFHGIQSPNFPAKTWGRVYRYWRSHMDVDFQLLVKMATQEVLKLRTG